MRIFFVAVFLILVSSFSSAAPDRRRAPSHCQFFYAQVGVGWVRLGHDQVHSPTAGVSHYYVGDRKTERVSPLLALGIAYPVSFHKNSDERFFLALEGDYINFGNLKGTLHPAIAKGGNYDHLRYSFNARSALLLLKGLYSYSSSGWLPYVSFGAGLAVNRLSRYSEWPTNFAAPQRLGHRSSTKKNLAYALDIGLYRRPMAHHISFDFSYRFIFANEGELRHPISGIKSLDSDALAGHFLVAELKFG